MVRLSRFVGTEEKVPRQMEKVFQQDTLKSILRLVSNKGEAGGRRIDRNCDGGCKVYQKMAIPKVQRPYCRG